jgi:hypothetical protein
MISEQKKDTQMLLNAYNDIGSTVNTGKIKYMEVGRQ